MIDNILDNSLVICNNSLKKDLLLSISQNKILKNIKYMNIKEFIDNYFGTYSKDSIYYLMKKYEYSYDVALEYLNNLFYNYDILNYLYDDLKEHDLLLFNNYFKKELESYSNIYVIGYSDIDKYVLDVLNNYNTKFINDNKNNYQHNVYEFDTQSMEILYVVSNIIDNYKNELNKVKLVNVNSEYLKELKRIFKMYNININTNEKNKIYSSIEVQKFLNNLSSSHDINASLSLVSNSDIFAKIVDIINSYNIDVLDDIFVSIIEKELQKTCLDENEKKDAVQLINIDEISLEDNYYYILNFNQGVIPKIFHDDDLIKDSIKIKLGLNTSLNKLVNYKNNIKRVLNNYKNITITYKLKDNYKEYMPSPLIEELNLSVIKNEKIKYTYSNKYNKLHLAKLLDDYLKYNVTDANLNDLYITYKDVNYLNYNNKFKTIDSSLLKSYLDNKIDLSYTIMNNYYHCKFKYYIENVLKLDSFEETFMTYMGKLYHFVLSKLYDDDFNLEKLYASYLKDKELTNKEAFFVNKLYKELEFICNTIKTFDRHSKLDKAMTEKEIIIKLDNNMETKFIGFVDKIKYLEKDGITFVSIIDYKTGEASASLDNINYGFNLQLPVYVYLINKEFKNPKVVGIYLQKLLTSKKVDSEDVDKDKRNNLKLVGYSTSDEESLCLFDDTYENSDVIQSMKVTNKGFYSYAKLFDDNDIDIILSLVDNHINEVLASFESGNFDINPKRIDNDLIGCKYCKFKDLCYLKEEDIVDLKYTNFQDIVKEGEENGMD